MNKSNNNIIINPVDGVNDLRSAITFLKKKGAIIYENESLQSTYLEIANEYKKRGSGSPAKDGNIPPIHLFNNVKSYPSRIIIGLMNSRKDCADLLNTNANTIAQYLSDKINDKFPPVLISDPPCQENVIIDNIDILKYLPILTFTPKDAGPFINMGMIYAEDPETGESDITIHRMCVQGKDKLSVYLIKNRHIEVFYQKAKAMNKDLPVTINIGLDPAIYLSSIFTYPISPLGFNEMNIAGAIRQTNIPIANAITNSSKVIAHSEIVLEGFITSEETPENQVNINGNSLPEFLGYLGKAQKSLPIIKITAITFRNNPIYQSIIGPGAELSNICGIATETSIFKFIKDTVTDIITNCYCPPAGGGKLVAFIQFSKKSSIDDAIVRQAGLSAFSAFHELKHVYLVDEDINIFDEKDILWAMTTRFQGNKSIITIPNLHCHPLDPSQNPEFAPELSAIGTTYKTVFDCTVPFNMKNKFIRV